jgi:hypothetical protein
MRQASTASAPHATTPSGSAQRRPVRGSRPRGRAGRSPSSRSTRRAAPDAALGQDGQQAGGRLADAGPAGTGAPRALDLHLRAQEEFLEPGHHRRRRSPRRRRARIPARRCGSPAAGRTASRRARAGASPPHWRRPPGRPRPGSAGPAGTPRRPARAPPEDVAPEHGRRRRRDAGRRSRRPGRSRRHPRPRSSPGRGHRHQQGTGLVRALLVLALRVAVGHDPGPACTLARPSGETTMVRMAMAVSTLPEKSM